MLCGSFLEREVIPSASFFLLHGMEIDGKKPSPKDGGVLYWKESRFLRASGELPWVRRAAFPWTFYTDRLSYCSFASSVEHSKISI